MDNTKSEIWTREMAQQLPALAALTKEQGSVPSNHMVAPNRTSNSRDLMLSNLYQHQAHMEYIDTHADRQTDRQTHTHTHTHTHLCVFGYVHCVY